MNDDVKVYKISKKSDAFTRITAIGFFGLLFYYILTDVPYFQQPEHSFLHIVVLILIIVAAGIAQLPIGEYRLKLTRDSIIEKDIIIPQHSIQYAEVKKIEISDHFGYVLITKDKFFKLGKNNFDNEQELISEIERRISNCGIDVEAIKERPKKPWWMY